MKWNLMHTSTADFPFIYNSSFFIKKIINRNVFYVFRYQIKLKSWLHLKNESFFRWHNNKLGYFEGYHHSFHFSICMHSIYIGWNFDYLKRGHFLHSVSRQTFFFFSLFIHSNWIDLIGYNSYRIVVSNAYFPKEMLLAT